MASPSNREASPFRAGSVTALSTTEELILAGVGLAGLLMWWKTRRSPSAAPVTTPGGPLGQAIVDWSIEELEAWGGKKPSPERIAEYFAPAMRNGKPLNMTAGNYCAVGVCFAAAQIVGTNDLEAAGIPHGYRVSGKELEDDAQKHGAWLPRDSATPEQVAPGDLVILNRGDPNDWTRHVGRIVEATSERLVSVDANGWGGAWVLAKRVWDGPDPIRGYVKYPATAGKPIS